MRRIYDLGCSLCLHFSFILMLSIVPAAKVAAIPPPTAPAPASDQAPCLLQNQDQPSNNIRVAILNINKLSDIQKGDLRTSNLTKFESTLQGLQGKGKGKSDHPLLLNATNGNLSIVATSVSRRKLLLVRCFGSDGTPDSVDKYISAINLYYDGGNKVTVPIDDSLKGHGYIEIDFDQTSYDNFRTAENGIKQIEIKTTKNTNAVCTDNKVQSIDLVNYYIKKSSYWEAPGYAIFPDMTDGVLGIWAPVGLFGTNFQRADNGMQFQVVPIGLAIGTKWFPGGDATYFGMSGLASWAISNTTSKNNQATNTTSNSSVTASSVSFGGLFDIDAWIYLGGVYSIDLSSNRHNPGAMLILGAGPNLVKFLNPTSIGK